MSPSKARDRGATRFRLHDAVQGSTPKAFNHISRITSPTTSVTLRLRRSCSQSRTRSDRIEQNHRYPSCPVNPKAATLDPPWSRGISCWTVIDQTGRDARRRSCRPPVGNGWRGANVQGQNSPCHERPRGQSRMRPLWRAARSGMNTTYRHNSSKLRRSLPLGVTRRSGVPAASLHRSTGPLEACVLPVPYLLAGLDRPGYRRWALRVDRSRFANRQTRSTR